VLLRRFVGTMAGYKQPLLLTSSPGQNVVLTIVGAACRRTEEAKASPFQKDLLD